MSEQDGRQATTLQRPNTNNPEAWKAYWEKQGQPWRIEPEINEERQTYLTGRRSIAPDTEKGIYSFKGIDLSRADLEWLLAALENGRGPVDWSDEGQRGRDGLDLRGADLCRIDLRRLPLANLRSGLTVVEWSGATKEQRDMAALLANEAYLTEAQGAYLAGAHLQKANFGGAHLQKADFTRAQLEGAYFTGAQLQGAYFTGAQLQGADLTGAQLEEANLSWAQLQGADLTGAQLQEANFKGTELEEANLSWAQLRGAHLTEAQLDRTNLADIVLGDTKGIGPQLVDVQWGNTNLSIADWSQVKRLGDEHLAQQKTDRDGQTKKKIVILREYRDAVRANRQLAIVLRNQGLNEDAARFAYRAQILQKRVLWFQLTQQGVSLKQRIQILGTWLFSWFFDLLAGYGYRPGRAILWYLVTIFAFALTYFAIGHLPFFPDAFVLSLTSFHGRGIFPGLGSADSLHNPLVVIAAFEAVIGLVIEISFIATFTQRFFGK